MIVLLLIPIGLVYLVLKGLYRLFNIQRTRFRLAAKTWIVCFIIELVLMIGISGKLATRMGLADEEALLFPIALLLEPWGVVRHITTGQGSLYLGAFLLPIIPAFIAYYIQQEETTRNSPS